MLVLRAVLLFALHSSILKERRNGWWRQHSHQRCDLAVPDLLVRGVDDDLVQTLKKSAGAHGRSPIQHFAFSSGAHHR